MLDVKRDQFNWFCKILNFFKMFIFFTQLCESKFYYIYGVLIYHIIYNYSQNKELSKEQSKGIKAAQLHKNISYC
jgi:hypothetical protein